MSTEGDPGQVGGAPGDPAPSVQLSALSQDAPQRGSGAGDGAGLVPHGHRWGGKLGGGTAKNRFDWYIENSGELTPRQMAILEVVSRLEIQYMNACSKLEKEGPLRQDNEPKALLGRVLELQREIRSALAEVFPGDAADDLSSLLGRSAR